VTYKHFHYRVTFTGYIRCFCATTSHNLVTLTFYILTLRVFHVQCFSWPTHIPIFIVLRLSVTELWITEFDHISVKWTVITHAPCHVTIIRGQYDPHFWNPWPQYAYSLCHLQGATTTINSCYMRKIAFIHCLCYKVHCACAVSRDVCIGCPPKPHVTIFAPELPIYYTNLMGLRRRLRGSIVFEHPHVKAIFGRKKLSSQNRSPKWRFSKI